MADKVTISGDDNIAHIKEAIRKALPVIRKHKEKVKAENDGKNAVRQNLAALGIPKEAFDQAMKYLDWDEDKKQGFDIAYRLVREVGGSPVRFDLFDFADREERREAGNLLHGMITDDAPAEVKKALELAIKALGVDGYVNGQDGGGEPPEEPKEPKSKPKKPKASPAVKAAADRAEAAAAKKAEATVN